MCQFIIFKELERKYVLNLINNVSKVSILSFFIYLKDSLILTQVSINPQNLF